MSDLISRQEAIDTVSQALKRTFVEYEDIARTIIGKLPSAQPEVLACGEGVLNAQPEIVRCGQCKYAEVADAQDNQDGYTCQFHRGSIWFSGSYCSWGERRTDE